MRIQIDFSPHMNDTLCLIGQENTVLNAVGHSSAQGVVYRLFYSVSVVGVDTCQKGFIGWVDVAGIKAKDMVDQTNRKS